ncbi:MAG: tyrosine-type recombinase/integrase [Vicinamibacterales bacterium]
MPTVMLTARFVDTVKPTPGKRIEYVDREVPGLALRVMPTGIKSWTVRYRHRSRLRRLTLGSVTAVSLSQARDRARDELHGVSHGADPASVKQASRKAETFEELAAFYMERWAKPRKRSWKADDNLIRRRILPSWRRRAIADITRRDVRDMVQSVADAGAPVVANRVAALLSKMFSVALDWDLVTVNPAVRIPRPAVERARDRVLNEDEIRVLWAAFDRLAPPMAAFYKLRFLTAQRGGEVASMRWADVDLDGGWWTVPASQSKNKLAHRVPLNGSAVTLLAERLACAHPDSALVLEAHYCRAGAGARGKRQQAAAAASFPLVDFRGHDLRRTAASFMASGGVPRLTISKILNHVEHGVTKVYDRHSYDPEKRQALEWWDRRLSAIVEGVESRLIRFPTSA